MLNTYLIDTYTIYAASALAAATCLRSLCGFALPLAGPSMFTTLGLGWGCTLLALVSIAIAWPTVKLPLGRMGDE